MVPYIKSFRGHCDWGSSLCFFRRNSNFERLKLQANGGENTIKLWDRISGSLKTWKAIYSKTVNSACFAPDGTQILSGFDDKKIKLWDQISGSLIKTLEGHLDSVKMVCFFTEGTQILRVSDDKMSKLWDLISGSVIKTLEVIRIGEICMFFSRQNSDFERLFRQNDQIMGSNFGFSD
jgi:WD40 repeat protein